MSDSASPLPYNGAREFFGLTQLQMALWLRVSRALLSQIETGRRSPTWQRGYALREGRLDMAALGLPYEVGGHTQQLQPPLPIPAPDPKPLQRRLDECRYQIKRLTFQLENMRRRATPFEARYRALPTLRTWTGPVDDPEQEARWLEHFEQEAEYELLDLCGAGPQRLLEARIAGFEREAELLDEMLVELLPAPPDPTLLPSYPSTLTETPLRR